MNTEATGLCRLALIIVGLPLLGFVIQVFGGTKIPPRKRQGDWIPTLCIFGSFVLACYMMGLLLSSQSGISTQRWYPSAGLGWLHIGGGASGGLSLDFGILVDGLTVVMLFVVTLVSFVVHLYSWGYMHGEARYNHFFAYLALFSFSMLGLCVSDNLLFLFIFWELVGVCSYFLIGFHFEKKSAQNAAIKAFLTTRVGDIGLLLAILIISCVVGSLALPDIFASVQQGRWSAPLLTLTSICIFSGAVGKSAQFPLHVWLPDAMEGPTPVSALIHAATMVAAGVYLVGRMFPFMAGPGYFQGDFFHSDALLVVALTGGFTAFFAATIAFVQTDIKKVLAYSTVSQLGYMMVGLGVGSVTAGLFHLTTHAFFKALLFLAAGSVIHAVHSNELSDMGGLSRKMRVTWITFLVGCLALSGLPFFSGFYSKEGILTAALAFGKERGEGLCYLPFVLAAVTAGMTAFYMFRLFFSAFHGEPRNARAWEHAHESPWTMTVPLVTLAFLSVVSGNLFLGGGEEGWFGSRVSSAILVPPAALAPVEAFKHLAHESSSLVLGLSVGMFLLGTALAALFFLPAGPFRGARLAEPGTLLGHVHKFLRNLWYVDALLTWLALRIVHTAHMAVGAFDKHVIDGAVNFWGLACHWVTAAVGRLDYWGVDGAIRGLGRACLWLGAKARRLQTGLIQDYVYASVFIAAGLFIVSVLILLLSRQG